MTGLAEDSVWLLVELFSLGVCPEVAMIRVVLFFYTTSSPAGFRGSLISWGSAW